MKRNPFLRVKLKSLAEEARIIHVEERRALHCKDYGLLNRLRDHRVVAVRNEARKTLLAYQFLRGIPYEAVERPDSRYVNWPDVLRMVVKYGDGSVKENDLKAWYAVNRKAA